MKTCQQHRTARSWIAGQLPIGLVVAVLAGCAEIPSPGSDTKESRVVVASIPPLGAVLRELAAGRTEVHVLLKAGASPHTYEPRPSDAQAAERSLALFYVAEDVDGWATRLPAPRSIATAAWIPAAERLPWEGHTQEENGEAPPPAAQFNTHYWGDPLLVKAILPRFVDALTTADPVGRLQYETNAHKFSAALDLLDQQVSESLRAVEGKKVALFHPSLNYFLRRYGIGLAGVVEPFGGKEMSPKFLKGLIDHLRQERVDAVLTEPQLNRRPAEVVAESGPWPLGELDPLGGEAPRDTYPGLILHNAGVLKELLR